MSEQLPLWQVPNPCRGICEAGPRGFCKGCLRTRDERFNWHQKPAAEQSLILRRLGQRRARLRQAAKRQQWQAQAASREQQLDLWSNRDTPEQGQLFDSDPS